MQFGTPAKLGQQRGRRQSKPCLLSQRPLAAANGEKEGKMGKHNPRVKGIFHRAAVNTDTRCIPSYMMEGMPRGWGAKEKSWRSGVKEQSWGSMDTRAINTYWFRIPLLLKESWKFHQPELGRTNRSALPRRDWGSWSWCGLKAWNRGNIFMKKLTLPQFIFSQLNIIRNYACSPWIFILILASN